MREIILYYTLSGSTKKYAEKLAGERKADVEEITEASRRNGFTAFVPGIVQAVRRSNVRINPIRASLESYDKITIAAPVWASHAAPAINSVIAALPAGKAVELILMSQSGVSESAKTVEDIKARGCADVKVVDVKSGK